MESVSATFLTASRAEGALHALERNGVEAEWITVEGRPIEVARNRRTTQARDSQVLRHVSLRILVGVGLSALIVAGPASLITAVINPGHRVLMMVVIGSLIIGSIIGALVSGVSSMNAHESWELTKQAPPGRVVIGVRAPDPSVVDRAVNVLRSTHPMELQTGANDGWDPGDARP